MQCTSIYIIRDINIIKHYIKTAVIVQRIHNACIEHAYSNKNHANRQVTTITPPFDFHTGHLTLKYTRKYTSEATQIVGTNTHRQRNDRNIITKTIVNPQIIFQ